MSSISGGSECGQYPRSLFKTDNELNGIQSSSDRMAERSGIDKGRGLEADKVTLSADALKIAEAQLQERQYNSLQAPSASSVNNTINTASESLAKSNISSNKVQAFVENTEANSNRSSFYALV